MRERRSDNIDDEKTTENLREIANNLDLISAGINKSNAAIAELKRKLAEVEGERDALRELNAELVEALEEIVARDYYSNQPEHFQRTEKARAAIAKAKG